jgi:hypothetical protein
MSAGMTKKIRIANVQNKEGKGERCDHSKRSFTI